MPFIRHREFRIRAKFFWLCAKFVTSSLSRGIVFLTTWVVLWGSYNMSTVQGYDLRRNAFGGDTDEAVSRFYCCYPGGKRMTCPFIHRVSQGVGSFWLTACCHHGIFIYRIKELPSYFVKYARPVSAPCPLPPGWGETRVISNAGNYFTSEVNKMKNKPPIKLKNAN